MSTEQSETEVPGKESPPTTPPASEEVVFVLRYDEELTFLVNEGIVRPGLLPSGLK